MSGDPEARRRHRTQRRERRMDPMLPDAPRPLYSQLGSRGARLAGGGRTADKVMRFAFGFSGGMAICGQVIASLSGREVDGSEGLMSVPLVVYAVLGFPLGLLASTLGLWMTQGVGSSKYLLRTGTALGMVAAAGLGMIPA
jgi:hypothetical protein